MRPRHKYNAVQVERDGFKFPSKAEGKRYDELKLCKQSGDCVMFLHQVPFRMSGSTYWADFMVFWNDGSVTVEDVKGMKTAAYKKQKAMMAVHFPAVEIQEL
ncbi:MAG: DUF1064 domain-containing protein [Nitrospina sp.]|nr:DUF1064 domain-containing protein [Nitrospina sp.]